MMYFHWLCMLFDITMELKGSTNAFNTETIKQIYEAENAERRKKSYADAKVLIAHLHKQMEKRQARILSVVSRR